MERFLIELPHSPDAGECAKVVQVFLSSGSHLVTKAEWGCNDDVHNAWLIVDVEGRDDAVAIVPPALRSTANVTGLNTFTLEWATAEIDRNTMKTTGTGASATTHGLLLIR
jgi:hypothetical protein